MHEVSGALLTASSYTSHIRASGRSGLSACCRWKNGHCRFGERCNFAHGEEELRKLPARGNGFQGPGPYGGQSDYRGNFEGGGYGQRGVVRLCCRVLDGVPVHGQHHDRACNELLVTIK